MQLKGLVLASPQKHQNEIISKTVINCLIKGPLLGASLTDALISNYWLTLAIAIFRGGALALSKLQTTFKRSLSLSLSKLGC